MTAVVSSQQAVVAERKRRAASTARSGCFCPALSG